MWKVDFLKVGSSFDSIVKFAGVKLTLNAQGALVRHSAFAYLSTSFAVTVSSSLELEIPPRHKADLKDALQAYNQGASDPRLRGGIFVFRDGTEVTELCSWDEQGIFVSGAGKIESRRLKELNEMSGIQ